MNGVWGLECKQRVTYLSSLFSDFINAHVFISIFSTGLFSVFKNFKFDIGRYV